jgi:hypothetical protein
MNRWVLTNSLMVDCLDELLDGGLQSLDELPDDSNVEGPGLLRCGDNLIRWQYESVQTCSININLINLYPRSLCLLYLVSYGYSSQSSMLDVLCVLTLSLSFMLVFTYLYPWATCLLYLISYLYSLASCLLYCTCSIDLRHASCTCSSKLIVPVFLSSQLGIPVSLSSYFMHQYPWAHTCCSDFPEIILVSPVALSSYF